MTCPTCHHEIGSSKSGLPLLACPRCAFEKSYQAVVESQRQFVARMLKGDRKLTLTKPAEENGWHIAIASYSLSWCGRELNTHWKKKQLAYPKIDSALTPLCVACLQIFQKLPEDQPVEVA